MKRYILDVEQGSQEWLDARCGLITASEMRLLMTPNGKVANNEKSRAHIWELAAQRATKYVEPQYISDDMLRGMNDEIKARTLYSEKVSPVSEAGLAMMETPFCRIGYSPDGLVGDDGLIEIKSRRQALQFRTIFEGGVREEYMLQIQTGLLVTGRDWLDFISYSGGMPLHTYRVYPDAEMQDRILETVRSAEENIAEALRVFEAKSIGLYQTERDPEEEEMVI